MDVGLGLGEVEGLTPEEYQRLQTAIWEKQRAEADLEAEADDEPDGMEPESDAAEPPELQDMGESDAWIEEEPPADCFASERRTGPPRFLDLPHSARPFVRYCIDRCFQVHRVDERDDLQAKRCYAIAKAIALHLLDAQLLQLGLVTDQELVAWQKKRERPLPTVAEKLQRLCKYDIQHKSAGRFLKKPGDWCQIPHIDRDRGLLELVKAADPDEWESDLSHVSELPKKLATIKDFAIMLPSGDVLAVPAFINGAREGKRATRAAALRLAADKPPKLAGDDWEDADWEAFEHAQVKAKADAKHREKEQKDKKNKQP
jgi:hypothetical protein